MRAWWVRASRASRDLCFRAGVGALCSGRRRTTLSLAAISLRVGVSNPRHHFCEKHALLDYVAARVIVKGRENLNRCARNTFYSTLSMPC